MAICPAVPNSFHTVTLEDEVEMTQHANPTVSTPLTRRGVPSLSRKCDSQASTPRATPSPGATMMLLGHPPVLSSKEAW